MPIVAVVHMSMFKQVLTCDSRTGATLDPFLPATEATVRFFFSLSLRFSSSMLNYMNKKNHVQEQNESDNLSLIDQFQTHT